MNGNSIYMKKSINNLSDRFIKITDLSKPEIKKAYNQFVDKIGTEPKNNVWFDSYKKECFGADYTYQNCDDPTQACFLTEKKDFKFNNRHGIPHFNKIKQNLYQMSDLIVNEDFIIESFPQIKKFADKSILIIGAGPSTNMVDLESIDSDFVWVCNDFLNHEKVKNLNPSLFYMSNEVYKKKTSREFLIKNQDCLLCFDINVHRDFSTLNLYKTTFKDKCFLFSTRMFTTIGIVPRMINLAAIFGAKEIKVVGLDGHPEKDYQTGKGLSAFEKSKKNIPNGQTFDSQLREYMVFWEFIKNNFKNLKIVNLGHVYEHNITKKTLEVI